MSRRSCPISISIFLAATGCAEVVSRDHAGEPGWSTPSSATPAFDVERITTAAPFPRGLAIVDDKLYVLCRGRVREAGGVSAAVEDQAGTIYEVDPSVSEPASSAVVGDRIRQNGRVIAHPTEPPFHLWKRTADPPTSDRETDRPYCTLRYHEPTKSFYLCAFSGVDKAEGKGSIFSKNLNDALLRYDLRTQKWYEIERHNIEAGGIYPHHDPKLRPPPHGWLNGPDNCLALGKWLYAVAKDNSTLVRYDLGALIADPEAGPPPSELILTDAITLEGEGPMHLYGHSTLAAHDGYLYLGCRTSSEIVRFPIDAEGNPIQPIVAQRVARFTPYDPASGKSANLTDMVCDREGFLYVVSAKPSRIYRFRPDPAHVFDARAPETPAWLDMARLTGNPNMKSENVLVDAAGRVYVTAGDAYDFQDGAGGVVYRATPRSL